MSRDSSAKARAPRRPRRSWTIVIVPHRPGAPTRTLHVGPMLARLVTVAGLAGLIVLGTALSASHQSTIAAMDEATEARREAAAMGDSMRVLSDLRDSIEAARALAAAAPTPAPAPAARPAEKATPKSKHRLISFIPAGHARALLVADAGIILPVNGRITSGFTNRRLHPILGIIRPHKGVDLAASAGTPIIAPASGIVHFVGRRFGAGLVVEVAHANGVVTRYDHCRAAYVREGQRVDEGDAIASVGSSGLSTGPHLHYEVLVNGTQVDPLHYRVQGIAAPATPLAGAANDAAVHVMSAGGAGSPEEQR